MPPLHSPHLLIHQLRDELVLYNPHQDVVHTLNSTALLVWECCDGAHEIDDIIGKLTASYDVAPGTARQDIQRILDELQILGLVKTLS